MTFLEEPSGPVPAPRRTGSRLLRPARVLALLISLLVGSGILAAPSSAETAEVAQAGRPTGPADDPGFVSVIEMSGLLDAVLVDFLETELAAAERQGAVALVLQLNSPGAAVSDARLDRLVARLESARVPIDVWVGPSGSRARRESTALLAAARTVGVSPGSRIEVTRTLLGDRRLGGAAAVGDTISAGDAVDLGLADNAAPTIGQFVIDLDGVETRVVGEGAERRREPVTRARFSQLPLLGQLMHTVASPPVAYLLFVIGLALIVFELFTAGVGVAGLVGAGSLVLGSYGLAALPTNALAVALLMFAMFGFAVDVQTGVPRVWSAIAGVSFTAGSLTLYDGMSLSWITLLVAIAGIVVAMIGGMPAMVRSRFSTPTIGREWMVGEVGTALGSIAPEGTVAVRDAPWRARTHRATPIELGQEVRVVSIDGLLLEVEPLEPGSASPRSS